MDLPCDGDGACMVCKKVPPKEEAVLCCTCGARWHGPCLSSRPESLASAAAWECPDCSGDGGVAAGDRVAEASDAAGGGLIASIRAIEADASLSEREKARRRQELLGGAGRAAGTGEAEDGEDEEGNERRPKGDNEVLDLLDEKFNCIFCMRLPDRPVTTPCGHNFCLKCFQKWVGQGKRSCAKCRSAIPLKMAEQPRINSALVVAMRMAKAAKSAPSGNPARVYHFARNENRPEKAFTTERAKRAGKANACSGQIFVTVPPDHFGPILAEHDPKRNKGVLVGEVWEDRFECRQWGAHFPHVAGIAGQSEYGAQSVALSGGYEDDEDHGEWFLYTGSGGRDLSGNKRTSKEQAFDQKFEKLNDTLRISCKKGYPVRVVRSHKEKRSAYAPESGVRYDGIYRIEKCWCKVGIQGFKVCRYLFVRCDNEPAPWTSDEQGDRPRPLPTIEELAKATDITVRKDTPAWDYDEKHGWKWKKPPPLSRKSMTVGNPEERKRVRKPGNATETSVKKKLLKEFCCEICWKVMNLPLTTPCAHNFCKPCLLGSYADQSFMRDRTRDAGRTLRAQKIVKKCPSCPNDISDFLQNPQVNRELMDFIESLQKNSKEENARDSSEERSEVLQKSDGNGNGDIDQDKSRDIGGTTNKYPIEIVPDSLEDGEQSDGVQDTKLESVDGDSEVNADNPEAKEGGDESALSKGETETHRKRKKAAVRKRQVKRFKKFEENINNFDGESSKMEGREEEQQHKNSSGTAMVNLEIPAKEGGAEEQDVQPMDTTSSLSSPSSSKENKRYLRRNPKRNLMTQH